MSNYIKAELFNHAHFYVDNKVVEALCNVIRGDIVLVSTFHPPRLFSPSRAQSYAERLRLGLAVIHGEAQCSESDMADGRHSPPCVRNTTGHTGLELPCKRARLNF